MWGKMYGMAIEKSGKYNSLLSENNSIRRAMEVIDSQAIGLSVVVSPDGIVVGVITDGDIRRALLSGKSLEDPISPHISRSFISVKPDATRTETLDLMQALQLQQIPIIDSNGKLCGMHTLHNILGTEKRPNWAVIMAGGKGTRLRPITENLPKPMVPVAGRPILERLVLHLVGYGIQRIYISVNYLSHLIERHFSNGAKYGCRIEYLKEEKALGTGGALSLLPEYPSKPIVVLNGDLVIQANISAMLDHHIRSEDYATIGVRPYQHQVAYGCVEIDENGKLIRLQEKPVLEKHINAGVYILSPRAVRDIPLDCFFPITELFVNALINAERCGTYFLENDWIDVGTPANLKNACGETL
jgi:dTDP-glucose pyrophosphorylase